VLLLSTPALQTLAITAHGEEDINGLIVIEWLSNQLFELSLHGLVISNNSLLPSQWASLIRLRLIDVVFDIEALFALLSNMPILESLCIQDAEDMYPGNQGIIIAQADHPRPKLHHIRDVFLSTDAGTTLALLQILYPSRQACRRLHVKLFCPDINSIDELAELLVHIFEYVLEGWRHLFALPFSPITLVSTMDYWNGCRHTLRLVSESEPCSATVIQVPFVLAMSHRYHAQGVSFAAVEVWGLEFGSLPNLAYLLDVLTPSVSMMILRECSDFSSFLLWWIEYAQMPLCTIKTLEMWYSRSDMSPQDIERFRSSGVVDNINFIIDEVLQSKQILDAADVMYSHH
jgi:hypothetical protein